MEKAFEKARTECNFFPTPNDILKHLDKSWQAAPTKPLEPEKPERIEINPWMLEQIKNLK